jgi:hypothetical protein
MVGILGANSVSGGYEIDNSLRFNDGDSPKLAITPGGAGDRDTFTFSFWIKRTTLGAAQRIFSAGTSIGTNNDNVSSFLFESNDTLKFFGEVGGSVSFTLQTNRLFRDPSAWYHIVVAVDTEDGTAANRIKLYVNGVQESSFSTATYMSQNTDTFFNATNVHNISYTGGGFIDGYLAEFHHIDGTQLAATDFGEFNNNGVWIPKAYTGAYGTNGFYLEFKQTGTGTDASGMGADTSGNDNHWAVTNLAATDVTTDTPTNNFMTLNPLAKAALAGNPSEGNLIHAGQTSGYAQTVLGTLAWHGSGGKWYWEMEQGGATAGNYGFIRTDRPDGTNGVGNIVQTTSGTPTECVTYDWAWGVNPSNGNSRHDNNSVSYGLSLADGDHGMVAVDTVAGKAWWGKNGTWFASGNPATGDNPAFTDSDMTEGIFTIYSIVADTDGRIKRYNFGNPPTGFAISSGNADANGYGNFEYAPPSGYYSLCTKNLAEFG